MHQGLNHAQSVFRLNKSLYGLKQASRNRHAKFSNSLEYFGFRELVSDHPLFVITSSLHITLVMIYVDDKIITGSDPDHIVQEVDHLRAKVVNFLMEQNLKLNVTDDASLKDPSICQRLVERQIYLTITRPEIIFAINTLSQLMHSPPELHMDATLWILRYLKSTPDKGILLCADNKFQLSAFCDSDWTSYLTIRRSVTGYCMFLRDNPISWCTKK
ncbi:Retrovirus-related Pol polyprotein from transposon RE1-like protein [Drosera capensis]